MAASSLPIPEAPRTPSPLDNDFLEDEGPKGLGLEGGPSITTDYDYDIQQGMSDSPSKPPDSSRTTDSAWLSPTFSTTTTSTGGLSPHGSLYTPITPQTASTTDGAFPTQSLDPATAGQRNPFNFTTTQYVAGGSNHLGRKPSNDTLIGKRRGHKYKHSSIHAIAMDSIIQPPVMRTPLSVPSSLPIPTRKEAYRSLTSNQSLRLAWCACHFSIAAFVQYSGAGSLAMTALSRLLLFDAAGATVCVIVDVMGNFEVWKRSSIKHPFGLERADVLAGFGMAVFIAFMGLDILSHGIEHSLENLGSHEPHTSHAHSRVATGSVDIASLLAIISTLVSAILLKNHKRIGKATNFALIAGWGKILGNPSHVLTLSGSVLLLVLPLLSIKTYTLFDLLFSVLIAVMMITLGVRLGTRLASMLLMSYKPTTSPSNSKKDAAAPNDNTSIRSIISSIAADPSISTIEEAKFWQVHYGLCMANLKLRYLGSGEDIGRIRQRVTSLIRQRLGGKWEMAVDSQ
ncbi:cation diffusion zinc membrane transporter Zrg17 [Vermiconidia calcicola]|uniref:Cation diffusion zinc membrane transporter Zrg17 n=1 Tax=Vermiconidia calcicola TaxID=1690605 RepID=A0ACC3N9P7_9PEZI|nr:cation diffusion zinc membrane transporter Zrg17 [Vermiconidia calcicola]